MPFTGKQMHVKFRHRVYFQLLFPDCKPEIIIYSYKTGPLESVVVNYYDPDSISKILVYAQDFKQRVDGDPIRPELLAIKERLLGAAK